MNTRAEVTFAVNMLSQFMQNPRQDHLEATYSLKQMEIYRKIIPILIGNYLYGTTHMWKIQKHSLVLCLRVEATLAVIISHCPSYQNTCLSILTVLVGKFYRNQETHICGSVVLYEELISF